ncbi:MAG: hypothetical protein HC838_00090 [Spirulinaceae cyanobacterium RM2_2_10]|nr:hypothetical protein [Spirulinaceae cyanobacterium RM2_2_10]
MAAFFSALIAIFEAIPAIKSLFEQFVIFYLNSKIASMASENRDALKKAIEGKDQRDLEKVLANPNAGEPSRIDGVRIRDSIPGVRD